jgi:hypothetical protein
MRSRLTSAIRGRRSGRIAWAAVKRSYVKVGGSWIGRSGGTEFS